MISGAWWRPFRARTALFATLLLWAVAAPTPATPPRAAIARPTYTRDVAPMLQRHCWPCHRQGQVGPFPLETFEQARKRAGDIASVVAERRMPPWKPVPGVGPKFKSTRALPPADCATLAAWAEQGAPLGAPAPSGSPPKSDDGWALGTPDLTLTLQEDFPVPAEGDDIYRCFVIPTHLPRDVYIAAVEYRPGNRRVVHHMTTFVDTTGEGRKKDKAGAGPGYACLAGTGVTAHGDLGGWAPGNEPSRLPEGIGRSLPRAADVVVQIHYHPSGRPERDRSTLGLHFCRVPIRQTLQWNGAANHDFHLPAGRANVEVRASWYVPVDVVALAVAPHMHRLGRDMAMSVTAPDGRKTDLIRIDDWDFGWQNTYYFERPVELRRGSVVHVVAHFDNSAGNPRNANRPPRLVRRGEGSGDEMCVGYIAVVKKGQDLSRPGERDDLFQTFVNQRLEALERRARAERKRGG